MIIDVQINFVLYFVKLSVSSGFYYAHTHHSFIVFCSQSSLVRLSNLRLSVSHTFLYKKMDEFGDNHLSKTEENVKKESDRLASELPITKDTSVLADSKDTSVLSDSNAAIKHLPECSEQLCKKESLDNAECEINIVVNMPKDTSYSLQGQCPAPGDKEAD